MRECKLMVLWTLFLGVLLMLNVTRAMSSMEGVEIRYVVTTRGFQIGNVIVAQKAVPNQGEQEVYFENRTDVSASFLWMRYSQSQSERAALKRNNLVQYSRKGKNNDADVSVDGWLSQGTFNLMVTENGKQGKMLIPRRDYDRTTMECPEAFMDFQDGKSKEGSYSVRAVSLHRPLSCNQQEWICEQPAMPETEESGSIFFHR